MWSPPDIYALPSAQDKIHATEAIRCLEVELEAATDAVLQAQQRVDSLRRNLSERRAWLAPIRRVPNEVLAMVFVRCSEGKWSAPLVIQAVNRHWRDVVRATSGSWKFVPWYSHHSYKHRSPAVMSLFLERSRCQQRHVNLPIPTPEVGELLQENGQTVVCLSHLFFDESIHLESLDVEALKLNCIDPYVDIDIGAVLDVRKLPKLKTLSLLAPVPIGVTPHPRILILQHLELNTGHPRHVTEIIECCSGGLKALILSFHGGGLRTIEPPTFHFPHLHTVSLHDRDLPEIPDMNQSVFSASAPNLRTYVEKNINGSVFGDTTKVLYLRTDRQNIDLSTHRELRILEVLSSSSMGDQLRSGDVCPELERFIVEESANDVGVATVEHQLKERETRTTRSVAFIQQDSFIFNQWIKPIFSCADGYRCYENWQKFVRKEEGY